MLLGDSVRRIFVTGGAGFIGSHVVDILLPQGYEVTVYDNLSNSRIEFIQPHFDNPQFHFIQADVLDLPTLIDSLRGHDLVWHLAANTDIIGGYAQPERDLRDCTMAAFNIVEAMRVTGIRPILFSSTGAVYGDLCRDDFVSEAAGPLLPVSTYGAGKIGSEAFLSAYSYVYGLRAWMFRFGNVIGARMTHGVIYDFIHKMLQNPRELLIRGDGQQEKNYFLVEECIEGMAYGFRNILMTEEQPCNIFNLGTTSISKVQMIAEIIREEMDLPEANILIEGTKKAWPGDRSEERRVGKEWRSRWSTYHEKKKRQK